MHKIFLDWNNILKTIFGIFGGTLENSYLQGLETDLYTPAFPSESTKLTKHDKVWSICNVGSKLGGA